MCLRGFDNGCGMEAAVSAMGLGQVKKEKAGALRPKREQKAG